MSRKLDFASEVRRLATERDAVILAHNYQSPEIQDVADHVGDSLALARLDAGVSLADSITAAQLREWKAQHPGAVVVAYVNTSAEVKAESDVCCTSANAVEIVAAIPAEREVLFLPDQFLGAHVRREAGRDNRHFWMGEWQ